MKVARAANVSSREVLVVFKGEDTAITDNLRVMPKRISLTLRPLLMARQETDKTFPSHEDFDCRRRA